MRRHVKIDTFDMKFIFDEIEKVKNPFCLEMTKDLIHKLMEVSCVRFFDEDGNRTIKVAGLSVRRIRGHSEFNVLCNED